MKPCVGMLQLPQIWRVTVWTGCHFSKASVQTLNIFNRLAYSKWSKHYIFTGGRNTVLTFYIDCPHAQYYILLYWYMIFISLFKFIYFGLNFSQNIQICLSRNGVHIYFAFFLLSPVTSLTDSVLLFGGHGYWNGKNRLRLNPSKT